MTAGTKPTPSAIERSAYIWNTVGGLLMAFQSVIMLMVLTRVCSVVEAGIFTIAYANANLFLNLGKYGMRNFQVSDIRGRFPFRAYLNSRIATCAAMMAAGAVYTFYSAVTVSYAPEKTVIILVMLAFKLIDAVEDVFNGNYQQQKRLDIAARLMTVRLATTITVFAGGIALTRDLLSGLIAATAFTTVFLVGEIAWAWQRHRLPADVPGGAARNENHPTLRLLKECFPVFLAFFLLFYIGNAPKYAIDAAMDDISQAYYGYIAMPVFVVGLLATFIYNPIIVSLTKNWAEGDVATFVRRFLVQCLCILGITVVCVGGAWLLGVPVLNVLYNAELAPYRMDLLILVAGGGLLALTTLFTTGITIIRCQDRLIWGYAAVAVLAFLISPVAVRAAGIDGASWTYFGLMAVLTLWFGVIFALGVRSRR